MLSEQAIDWHIRRAMHILENEPTPLPTTADVAGRVRFSQFHFVRLFQQVGLTPQDYGRTILLNCAASRPRSGLQGGASCREKALAGSTDSGRPTRRPAAALRPAAARSVPFPSPARPATLRPQPEEPTGCTRNPAR